MSETFDRYKSEFKDLTASIARKTALVQTLSGAERKAKVTEVQGEIDEADLLVRRMDMEARGVSPTLKQGLLDQVKKFQEELVKARTDFKAANSAGPAGEAARAELGLNDDYFTTSAGQREKLLSATDRLDKTTDRIRQGKQQLLETEELGVTILTDLHRQRETIQTSRDKLASADSNIGKARVILSGMTKRMMQNKMIMYGVIGFLVLIIFIIIIAKVR